MKKSSIALAVLGALASAASAQSSVTLSGIVDAGVRRVGTATGHDWQVAGQQSFFNHIKFTGVEDLGGGMRASFRLEHRFRIQNGTNNSPSQGLGGAADCNTNDNNVVPTPAPVPCVDPFWRRSYVGLASSSLGEIRLGRQDMLLQEYAGAYEPFSTGTVASTHTGGINATVRANNSITYHSPNMGGLVLGFGIAEAAGQNQGVNGQGEVGGGLAGAATKTSRLGTERPLGFNFIYTAGPFSIVGGYDRNAGDLKTVALYSSYDFGGFKLMGQFEKGDNDTSSNPAIAIDENMKNYSIGVSFPLGQFQGRLGAVKFDSDLNNRDGTKVGIGAVYYLSKRTSLYTDLGKPSGNRFSAATKKAAFDLGMTHVF